MKTKTLLQIPALVLAGATASLGANITWDGGGGDLSWHNPLNWSGDQVPGTADDAVINVPTNVTIECNGNVTVRSIQCQGGLRLGAPSSLSVTAGSSLVEGPFTLSAGGTSLWAEGSGVAFVARGPTDIQGHLIADYGAAIVLTNMTTLLVNNQQIQLLGGNHGSGLVDLAQVTNVLITSGGNPNARLDIQAWKGGRVDLRRARIAGESFSARAGGEGSLVDLSGLSSEWGTTPWCATLGAQNGGTIWIPNVNALLNVWLTLSGTNGTPTSQLRSVRDGALSVSGLTPDFSGLTNVDGSVLQADNGAVLNLSGVCRFSDVTVNNGAAIVLTNVTSLVVTNMCLSLGAGGGGGRVDLSSVTNIVVASGRILNVSVYNGARLDLQHVESITGSAANFLSDGTGTVIDLSRLSGFVTPLASSSLTGQNGGVILINNNAVFLLANVAVTLPGLILQATPAMVLHAQPWHSYWVEQRDARWADCPWQFVARVPVTNTFQTFAPAPPPNAAFRVWEFVADPPIIDLWQIGPAQTQVVLYGATNQSYQLEWTPNVNAGMVWQPDTVAVMTNAFRLFPPAAATDDQRFFRAKQL